MAGNEDTLKMFNSSTEYIPKVSWKQYTMYKRLLEQLPEASKIQEKTTVTTGWNGYQEVGQWRDCNREQQLKAPKACSP